jgi:hypothetical protein
VLTIGPRVGTYPDMPATREFEVVLVGPGQGAGPERTRKADRVIHYTGVEVAVPLR